MIRPATPADVPVVVRLIRDLAEYERLSHAVALTEADLRAHLFGPRPYAEVLLAEDAGAVVGFALFFHNYSTFRAKPGIYLEDLFVIPEARGNGHGKALLRALVEQGVEVQRFELVQPSLHQIFLEKVGATGVEPGMSGHG